MYLPSAYLILNQSQQRWFYDSLFPVILNYETNSDNFTFLTEHQGIIMAGLTKHLQHV